MSDDPYAADAAFYDAIHGDFREDTGLWLSFAGRTDQPVLEVGCGTGRIALELARNGHEVTGIDPSAAMLAIARAKAEADALEVSFIEGRATELALEREGYGLVLIPLDVFLYCQDGEEQVSLLRTLGETLVPNGALAIDLPVRPPGSTRTRTDSRCWCFRARRKTAERSIATTCTKTTWLCKPATCASPTKRSARTGWSGGRSASTNSDTCTASSWSTCWRGPGWCWLMSTVTMTWGR
ncbi:MAG: class I SAM-dependent methyltransferase [Dehalococcoidia bacterium]|nr:class I SAM-dependent methyltransferase [Dehalococcoidia bacterium]